MTDRRTDRQADGRTDILRQHSLHYAYASHGKNGTSLNKFTIFPDVTSYLAEPGDA